MIESSTAVLPASTTVLVIGYGPVGATIAALLGRYGVATLVIDRLDEILLIPRAIALDNEALRILQMAGLGEDAFARIAIPEVRMHSPLLGQFARANTAGSIDGHPRLVTFYQPELEQALRREVAQWPNVQFCSGLELLDLQQDALGVTAILKDAAGARREVRADYLIGADGASSRVRNLIGQDFQGTTYAEDWLIVDAGQREGKAIDHVEFICDPRRPAPHMPAPGGRERWEFMLQPGESAAQMEQPEQLAALLGRWIQPQDLHIERQAVYRFHARCCDSFQQGRVFLAGDAAHITPPFVGQGLVAGLRDAANLCWKLAWVCRGHAAPAILASYDSERRPHAHKMINLAKRMGHLIMPRSQLKALLVHGLMRLAGLVPPLRRLFEELKIKPANHFASGLFVAGKSSGGQLAQGLVKPLGSAILLSDEVLGDQLSLVGFGVDPQAGLDEPTRTRWLARGGQFLQVGLRGQRPAGNTRFVEDMSDALVPAIKPGQLAVVRPDRVIMHSAPAAQARQLLEECLALLD
ncbi:bifunctional 3-(3-hydroxy-phenyl)propionate/3-hydroxycinnamic acid hydroxylase [Pseudomonas sp. N040]|uniref:bifunctional 3-(3-hydroxy-phenyl)propionate/3-hydroxycinnamic acid hydroxylase n=1 Tax=Pseudomonas sp. N040 TaxID=2785325 RepID=UPI0018A2D0EC|nr:bifunctional 3-(3-hydroxy-phenyl)propionate/3-hydroxycinnamic acid hydroxylase [Pseudomonas sp. N040]MBF7730467.1 bifunctional 3-(3-hydroxy-phenyl)propionate/3-hydroxycinnamic acid hydroxylase [Pseudomonas sp. N040]MBW7014110.1 bifunctional 3-(3-hydroxy-phenyl)propionate/3-hydroxycinnamic acid hydroxylase [Pseudomonas sp. N040]